MTQRPIAAPCSRRTIFHRFARITSAVLALLLPLALHAAEPRVAPSTNTVLGIQGTRFTLNDEPTFLTGFSYYAALGAPENFIRQDIAEMKAFGFNWLRVWATWGGFGTNISAITEQGLPREPHLSRLKWLVSECNQRGLIVDVTLARGKELPEQAGHLRAVETLVAALKPFPNWYLDLGNERDVQDARFVSLADLKVLRAKVRSLDRQRLVTASFGGHDLSEKDIIESLGIGIDFLSPHRPRHPGSPAQTEAETRRVLQLMKQAGRMAPVHHQEPFRRGYTAWQPTAEDFLTDLRGAIRGGAAGWCFHNGSQRSAPDEQPRRSFDLRAKRLVEQFDAEEKKMLRDLNTALFPAPKQE
jgi:hypothetical protein